MQWAGFAYLVAAVCFIMALRGLSHPESARNGNRFGMVGMAIAVITTILMPNVVSRAPTTSEWPATSPSPRWSR